jgi:cytosine/adenosine deaminase-related metal-dependent hydrolase
MPDTLLIRNARVVTMDHARRVIDEGFVAVRGPVIDAVGPMSECPRDADQVIDASGSAALPGFVNAHAHSLDILLRGGVADDRPLYDWLVNVNLPAGARYRISDNDLAVRLFAAEALRSGITTVVDQMETPFDAWDDIADTVVATYGATGMRAVVCQMFYDTVPEHLAGLDLGRHTGPLADLLERIGAMIVRHHGSYDGRISFWPAPGLAVLCTAEAVLGAQRLARSHGVMTTIHVAESVHDRVQQGMSSIAYLADIGYLAPDVLAGHCVQADGDDIRTLARTGTKVSTQPVSNLFLGNGIAPVAEMHTAGITVALGTDDGNCNNSVNMLADMKFAALLQKGRYGDAAALTAQRVLEMATIEGARAVGMAEEIGSLEPGKRADVILIDMQAAHMQPHQSIASALVYQANGTEVHTALIDGRVVMADRQPAWLGVEAERELLDDVRAATARILSESGVWPRR